MNKPKEKKKTPFTKKKNLHRSLNLNLKFYVYLLVTQSCPTLCDPVDCSPPGSSVHGILQAGILEWVAIPFSRGSSWPRDWTQVSCTAGGVFTICDTREAQFAVCAPKRASYLFGCLGIYIKASQTAEGSSPWKSPWSTTTSQQVRTPIQWCPKQEWALDCTAPQGPSITDRHWAVT